MKDGFFFVHSWASKVCLCQSILLVHLVVCVWKWVITLHSQYFKLLGIFITYFSLLEWKIMHMHVCLLLYMECFGIKSTLFGNTRDTNCVWSVSHLVIRCTLVAHGKICVHKKLDYPSPSIFWDILSYKWRFVKR